MATPQLSPGVLIREVDLTVGRAENVLDNIGAIAGPFLQGPVNDYDLSEDASGISSITFTGTASSVTADLNVGTLPRGGVIVSVGSSE